MSATRDWFDFIVVGLGPSGLMASAYLAQKGYSVAAIERHEKLYGLPRAGHVDHEIVRYLQELGVADLFLEDAHPTGSYTWFNGHGQVLLNVPAAATSLSGFSSDYMMYQPTLDDALLHAIDGAHEAPTMFRGYQLTDLNQNSSGVTAIIHRRIVDADGCGMLSGDPRELRGGYLLAADGARSQVRERLGIAQNDLGFNETWLDVDTRLKRPIVNREPHQICDPRRPIYVGPLGRRHHRWEWAILPGENPADFTKPEKAWELLAEQDITTEDVEIVRQQVYTFEARLAKQWRLGRIFLVGDAAHSMPPFMGQGACSGMRDAVNLAWKLDLVIKGIAGDAILNTYQAEREPHTERWIDLSVQTGAVSCTLDPKQAAQRDALFLSGDAPPMPDFPILTTGILDVDNDGRNGLIGTLFPQRMVSRGPEQGRFDDIVGRGFLLITNSSALCPPGWEGDALLQHIGGRVAVLSPDRHNSGFVDHTGYYTEWFEEHGIMAALTRPDFVIYGVARSQTEAVRLVAGLGRAVSLKQDASSEHALV